MATSLYFIRSDGPNPENPLDLFVRAPNEMAAHQRWLLFWEHQGCLEPAAPVPNYDLYLVPDRQDEGTIPWGENGVDLISSAYDRALDVARYALDDREHATVMAALRFWQRHHAGRDSALPEADIASNGGTLAPLNAKEVDNLCERLNLAEPL